MSSKGTRHDNKTRSGDDFDVLYIGVEGGNSKHWVIKACLAGRDVLFKEDTESQASLLPFPMHRKLRAAENLLRTSSAVGAYTGLITYFGTKSQKLLSGGAAIIRKYFVVKHGRQDMLRQDL